VYKFYSFNNSLVNNSRIITWTNKKEDYYFSFVQREIEKHNSRIVRTAAFEIKKL
jgi:hypothetical protein